MVLKYVNLDEHIILRTLIPKQREFPEVTTFKNKNKYCSFFKIISFYFMLLLYHITPWGVNFENQISSK